MLRSTFASSVLVSAVAPEPHSALPTNPWRQRLLAAIRANPGISFKELVATAQIGAPNARYHLDMLERAGLVRQIQVLHRLCYAPPEADLARVRRESYLRFDPRLSKVRAQMEAGPCRAADLVQRLRAELGISRSAGWKLVDRAVEAGFAEKLMMDRRLMISPR